MKLELHTTSRDDLFDAKADYRDGNVVVKKGSRININQGKGFQPSQLIRDKLDDKTIVDDKGILLKNVSFTSLSTAASFVAGRTSNGMITWKTPDGKYVREALKEKK